MYKNKIYIAGTLLLYQFYDLRYGTSGHDFIVHNDDIAILYFADQGEGLRFGIVPMTAFLNERNWHVHICRVVAALLCKTEIRRNHHGARHGRTHIHIDVFDE